MLKNGETGKCNARTNKNGTLNADSYGVLSAIAIDPVEKKPLYHYYPGSKILSVGSFGCNLSCLFCQNCSISQEKPVMHSEHSGYTPESLFSILKKEGISMLAYTYNEPVVFYEFMLDTASYLAARNMRNVMVTNGFIEAQPLRELVKFIDAFNVDLKSFRHEFYRKITSGSLDPVLRSLEIIYNAEKHLEITYLVIPGLNDDPEDFSKMITYLASTFGPGQVLHISRYFPKFRLDIPATPPEIIEGLSSIAREQLNYVYIGNTGARFDSNTYCPGCGNLLIERMNYTTVVRGLLNDRCQQCDHVIPGKFIQS